MESFSLWLKWSLRDLRQRWLQVVAIAMVIALGTGAYCGLGSNTPWRLQSLDESYARLNMYDLEMALAPGSTLDAGELARVVNAIEGVQDSEMRLILPTFVDASTPERTVMVSGRIIGVDVSSGGPVINGIHVTAGRALGADDSGKPVCIVEHNFANYYDLEPGDREIRVRGGISLDPVGTGMSPEYFMVMTEEGGMMAQAAFAALFLPLESVQDLAGLPGRVNDLLVTVADDADVAVAEQAIQEAMTEAFPQVGVTFESKSENEVYALLYRDIPGDQAMYDIFAFLLMAGAALGTFTLVSRMVEAQRREIGINMALGVEPGAIARRYIFAGAQIALLGMLFGLVAGVVLSRAYGNLIKEMLPMPYLETPFQVAIFLRGALLGIILPLLAAVYPIWRAVRVTPVEAIQTGHLVAKGGGLAPWLARFQLPGMQDHSWLSSIASFPFRNLSRNPRRTLLTIMGIAMAVILLVTAVGMLDSSVATLDAGRQEHLKGAPNRMLVTLDGFYPIALLPISGGALDPRISRSEPLLTLPGTVSSPNGVSFEVLVQLMDLDNDLWTPTLLRGAKEPQLNMPNSTLRGRTPGARCGSYLLLSPKQAEQPGIIISEKAARDLGVDVGDTVTLEHPYRETMSAYRFKESPIRVVAIHADVLRFYFYMDIEDAAMMNLDGLANGLQINPAAGVKEEEVRRELSQMPGVASVYSVSALVDTFAELIELLIGMLVIVRYVAILLSFLITFNTTSINVDERRRELATMFAFGTRVRTTIRMAVIENLVVGFLGTILGIGLGWVVLNQFLGMRMEETVQEIGLIIQVAPSTLALVAFFGVLVVALTPVLTIRKLARMDIPSTLRVVE